MLLRAVPYFDKLKDFFHHSLLRCKKANQIKSRSKRTLLVKQAFFLTVQNKQLLENGVLPVLREEFLICRLAEI